MGDSEEELSELEECREYWEYIESANDLHSFINNGTVPVEVEEEYAALRIAWWAFEKKLYGSKEDE
jgi:hypothetical protein